MEGRKEGERKCEEGRGKNEGGQSFSRGDCYIPPLALNPSHLTVTEISPNCFRAGLCLFRSTIFPN